MKLLQITAPGESAVFEVPVPHPGPGQVLVRVEAVTTCPQWDLHIRHNEPMFSGHEIPYPYAPGQPGHEATGEITAVGPDVDAGMVGTRVCLWRDQGHERQGCYAQYVVAEADNTIPVSAALAPEATAPMELAMCVGATFIMLKQMDAIRGRRFGVTGLGSAGLIAIQMAKAEGAATVTGFDLSAARREFAMARLGDKGLNSALDPAGDSARFAARPDCPELDCAVDCVGAKRSVEWIMDRTCETVALFGVQREDYTYAPRHYNGLRLCGYPGHSRQAAEYAAELLDRGALDLAILSTHQLPLERYDEGIALLESQEAVKICFRPWQ